MELSTFLLGLIIGFPLLGGLYLLIGKPADPLVQRRTTVLALTAAGLASLARFLLTGQAGCTFRSGPQGCLQVGILALSVLLLNALCLTLSLTRKANRAYDYEFFTLLNTAWGGAALAESWVVSLAALSLTLISTSRWVRARGGSVGFFSAQDDYRDDIGPTH